MAFPRVAPIGPCGGNRLGRRPYVKSNCFIYLLKTHSLILTKLGRNHPQGPGILSRSYGTFGPDGGQGEGPKGQNHAKFKHLLQHIQK